MQQDGHTSAARLFDQTGRLRVDLFDDEATELIHACLAWVEELDRSIVLPIDFVITLLRRGNQDMESMLAQVIGIPRQAKTLLGDLESYARRVERALTGAPSLHVDTFSLGSIGILHDSLSWATEVGREHISGPDLTRAIRWRIEYQESASIRWVLKQLGQFGSEQLFDDAEMLTSVPFSTTFWQSLIRSAELSAEAGLPFVGTPQLIAALCASTRSILGTTATDAGIRPERLRAELLRIVGNRSPSQPLFQLTQKTLTPRVIRMLEGATEFARREERPADEVDIIYEFLNDGGSSLELIRALGIEQPLRRRIERKRRQSSKTERTSPIMPARSLSAESGERGGRKKEHESVLKTIGRDLTEEAKNGVLPKVIGRDDELHQILRVLLRTEQRNPLLTGEPGVGKTALAMALAQKIVDREVPKQLFDCRVIEINSAALLGGTSYRGELEARITDLIAETEAANAILFIDEAHAIFAPTSGAGKPAETPNHFKTALAAGRIAVIAATTTSEYRRWIEQDPALKRRFEQIAIDELPTATTKELLVGLARDYESRWSVKIPESVVDDVIEFSDRYIPQRSQPDKAKKLLMDTAIRVSLSGRSKTPEGATAASESDAIAADRAVTRESIARVVHEKTRIPVERMIQDDLSWWQTLERRLTARQPDQQDAAHQIARRLFQRRFRPDHARKPYGIISLLTPTGVDSVEFAQSVAIECFGSYEAFTRIDMSDLADAHSMSRLFGAPPGYVGYSDEDLLITPLRQRPAQIIFFADFDAAHPRVQERLLRMMGDASARDTRGFEADLRHAIFVFEIQCGPDEQSIGFGRAPSVVSTQEHADLLRKLDAEGVARVTLTNPASASDTRQLHVARIIERFVEHAGIVERARIDELYARGRELACGSDGHTTLAELEIAVFETIIEPIASALFENSDREEESQRQPVDHSSS